MSMRWLACAIAAACCLPAIAADAAPMFRPFEPDSIIAIKRAHAGQPLVIVFWSTDCSYCFHNLELVARMQASRPRLRVVTVATDSVTAAAELQPLLARTKVKSETWAFGDASPDRLRYAIDPQWRGEMPRTYLIDSRGNIAAKSGVLTAATIEALR